MVLSGRVFTPWGFSHAHDDTRRLIEDYWEDEWPTVAQDFREMKVLGANVVRVYLQFGRFMASPDQPNTAALRRLAMLLALAEETGLYLDLTGLGGYHKADVPAWYDALAGQERWQAQPRFWEAIARQAAASRAIFGYDLMNEPVVAGAPREPGDWLGPPFAGKHFVQSITLDPAGRESHAVARISAVQDAVRSLARGRVSASPGEAGRRGASALSPTAPRLRGCLSG